MTYRLFNAHSSLTLCEGTLIFTDTRTGKTLTLRGGEEFILYLTEITGYTSVCRAGEFELEDVTCRSGNRLEMTYRLDDIGVTVVYEALEDVFSKTVSVESCPNTVLSRITTENRRVFAPVTRGGEGQPIFLGDDSTARVFCGAEFPVACNFYEGRTLCLTQNPYAELDDGYDSMPVVYGVDRCGDLEATFLDRMRKGARISDEPLRIYCDWGLHDDLTPGDPTLDAEMTVKNIVRVADHASCSGMHFDYYLMDAFWFERGKPYTHFDPKAFPQGMDGIAELLDKAGMTPGLWFDINGIHTRLAELPELAQYNTELGNGALCFACDEVAELIGAGIEKQIRELGVGLIKLDFGYFECKNPRHNHSTAFTESKEPAVRNFLRMLARLRRVRPDLKVLCYNGWMTDLSWMNTPDADRRGYAVSPYWSQFVEYVYCGDPRPSPFPSEDAAESLVWYTDGMIKLFSDALMPLACIDDDGAMMGHTATIYRLGKAHFRQSILMDVMRGGRKLMVYGDLRDLDREDHEYFNLVHSLYLRSMEEDYTTRLFGNAARGEIYGYETGSQTEGLLVVVNPTSRDAVYNLTSPRFAGGVEIASLIRDGEIVVLVDEYGELEQEWCAVGNVATVEVSAHGYTLMEWRLAPMETGLARVTVLPGDALILNTEGMAALELSFSTAGAPLKTTTGLPPQFTVISGGRILEPALKNPVWAGISWAHFKLRNQATVTLKNGSDLTFTLTYQFR